MMCRCWCLFVLSLAICTNIGYGWDTKWDVPFQFTCPRGTSLSQIKSTHHNRYEDRIWDFDCRSVRQDTVRSCLWSDYVNKWDAPFTYQCPHDYFVSGISGIHNNHKEDRRFKFYCCKKSAAQIMDGCYYTQRTTYDGYFNIIAPNTYVLKGVISEHHNQYEDRRFTFEFCRLH